MISLFVFLLILFVLFTIFSRRQNNDSLSEELPTPTGNVGMPTSSPIGPSDIPATPPPFTGGLGNEFTTEQQNNIDQERALRRISPFNGDTFTVTYNYQTDIFDVAYNSASEAARLDFEQWRNERFPAISLERFTIPN